MHSPPDPAQWPRDLIGHEVFLRGGCNALLLRHSQDDIDAPADSPLSTCLGRPWAEMHAAGATPEVLWPRATADTADVGPSGDSSKQQRLILSPREEKQSCSRGEEQTLRTAKLFPLLSADAADSPEGLADWWCMVRWLLAFPNEHPPAGWRLANRVSFADARSRVDMQAMISYQHLLRARVSLCCIRRRLLMAEPQFLQPDLRNLACGDRALLDSLLAELDRLASSSSPQLAARAFAAVAEALAMRAGQAGGLRSGPACNAEWAEALQPLREGRVKQAVHAMAAVRTSWIEVRAHPSMD